MHDGSAIPPEAQASTDMSPALKLAVTCRKLADEGHAVSLAGQVTARAGDGHYWTNSLAGFQHTTERKILRVDRELGVTDGDGQPNPGTLFHLWIYDARPDVNAIVHTHPPHASALSMLGEPLAVAHMDATVFHDDCAFLSAWPGVPVADEEGRIISAALGDKRSILLANHGYLTVGKTIEEATYLAVLFENAARLHLLARAAGDIQPIDASRAQEAHDFLLGDRIVTATFEAWARETLQRHPDIAH